MKSFLIFIKKINPAKIKWLLVFFVCFLFLLLTILYSQGYIILGGEGNYFTDFQLVKKYGSFAWAPLMNGTGSPNPILNMLIPVFDILSLLQRWGVSLKVINVLIVSSCYIFSFLSMLWMTNGALKMRFSISFLISLFYVLNPFSTYHLHGLMFWNSAPLFMLPLSFGILYRYYLNKINAFIFFGLATSFLAFSFQNPPYLGIFHIFLLLSVIIISFIWEKSIRLKAIIKYFFVVELSFFLFNFWWLANSLRFYLHDTGKLNLKNVSLDWSKAYMVNEGGIMNYILSFRTLIEPGGYSFFSTFYYNAFILLILSIPLIILVFLLFNIKAKKYKNKAPIIIFLVLLLVIFMNKGAFPPFGNFYQFCIKYVPLFELFKTPLEKFSVLFVFLFSLNLALVLNRTKNKVCIGIMIVYILILAIPYFTLNFIPDFITGKNVYVSRKFINKKEYIDSEQLINNHKINYRYLSLPGSKNYQVTMANHENKYYRGMDPVLYAINKGFIGAYSGDFNQIYQNLSNDNLENILSIYNVKKIMMNSDIYPSFGFEEMESEEKLDEIFSQRMGKVENGPIKIYSTNKFLPLFYTPEHIIMSRRKSENILRILLREDYNIRSGIFFTDQNNPDVIQKISNISKIDDNNFVPPSVEYKKINPVKYRIIIHQAKGTFPLVFSEAYHDGWKLYSVRNKNQSTAVKNLDNYKIITGNENDQATKEELVSYIKNRLITTLGSGGEKIMKKDKISEKKYVIDFISKNFQGTIQNDNLPSGKILDTWFEKPISEENHSMANGYANSWVIDTDEICNNNPGVCIKNPPCEIGRDNSCISQGKDGSYDFEMVVEFWPQRLFYVGLGISGATLLACLFYLGYDFYKRKNYAKIKDNDAGNN